MKTLLWKLIDGHKVIIGFDKPLINPIATRGKVHQMIKDWPETAAVETAKRKHLENLKAVSALQSEVPKNNTELTRLRQKIEDAKIIKDASAVVLRESHNTLAVRVKESYDQIVSYFNPKVGEEIIDEPTFLKVKESLEAAIKIDEALILLDGKYITRANHKGKRYFISENGYYVQKKVEKIGDALPNAAVLELDENQRKNHLDGIDRQRNIDTNGETKKQDLEIILRTAALKKNELEILGSTAAKALAESKDWYNAEVARIEAKYEVA